MDDCGIYTIIFLHMLAFNVHDDENDSDQMDEVSSVWMDVLYDDPVQARVLLAQYLYKHAKKISSPKDTKVRSALSPSTI